MLFAGCASTSDGTDEETSGPIAIREILDNRNDYDDTIVRIEGVAKSSEVFRGKAYEVSDGTGTLTVLSGSAAPSDGARVEVEGEFQFLFTTFRADTGGVLRELERTALQ
jgi:hypothetical protein